jgi:hypothetical protein
LFNEALRECSTTPSKDFSMNRILPSLATVALVFAAGASLAQEATPDTWLNGVHSTQTRAQVQAEAARARAAGEMKVLRSGYIAPVVNPALRTQVAADLQRARANGELARINAEVPSLSPTAIAPLPVYAAN